MLKKALWSNSMINLAKSKKNNDVFFNFVADLLGSRGYKISDNVFLSLNFSELAHVTSLLIASTGSDGFVNAICHFPR